jgi:hypothetical protein
MTHTDGMYWFNVGDPTLLGWFTLVAYLLAALFCWRASRVCRWGSIAMKHAHPQEAHRQHRLAAWWTGVALLMILLGLNKELDLLQKLVSNWGKAVALQQGWYEHRRAVQWTFIVVLVLLSAGSTAVVIGFLRDVLSRIALASAGVALILSYVLLRAAVFNVLQDSTTGHVVAVAWVLELSGLALVLWCAVRTMRSPGAGRP